MCYLPIAVVTVEVKSRYLVRRSPVTNVVEASKAGTFNVVNAVVRNQKVLLPPHINKVLVQGIVDKVVIVEDVLVTMERREFFLKCRMYGK